MSQPLVSQPQTLGVVLVTVGTEAEAQALAQHLVEGHLAACVSIMPIQSIYRWQGQVESAAEWQLVIKTDLGQFEALAIAIGQHHSYDVPEIIALPITHGLTPYLDWMRAALQG
jgi:periplasmic divalent cation tolerance protein